MSDRYPGMNPSLEDPRYWPSFHNELIFCIHDELGKSLPKGYRSSVEQRLAILPEDNYVRADSAVSIRPIAGSPSASAAVAERGAPTGIAGLLSEDMFEWYIEVRITENERKVVAVIELLSPSNKAAGTLGWSDYKSKQRDLLRSDTHLMEIDLLRRGTYTVAAPLAALPPRDRWDYIVSLYAAPDRSHFPYWLFSHVSPLPEVKLPLLPGDPDVLIDLQAAFEHAYRAGRYEDEMDAARQADGIE